MAKQGTAGDEAGTCPDAVKRLIDRFEQQSDQIRSPDYNETLIRIDFISPVMRELGWDLDNSADYAERYREVVHEGFVATGGGRVILKRSRDMPDERGEFFHAIKKTEATVVGTTAHASEARHPT